jgi:hypothetical protein
MRRHNLSWKGLWVSKQDWSCLRLDSLRKSGIHVEPPCLGRLLSVPCICVLHTGIRFKTGGGGDMDETLVRVVEECQLGTIQYANMATFWQVATTSCFHWDVLQDISKLGHCKYLPSNLTKGLSTPSNIESNFSVRGLMWSAKNDTSKSSWICLLPKYQGALATKQKHLDWRARSY